MKYLIIFNPKSKGGKNAYKKSLIKEYFEEKSLDFELYETKSLEDAYEKSLDGNKKNIDVIVAVGGDGTINKVINGFYNDKGEKLSDSKLAIIYTGTSPDFCKSYNIPLVLEEALEVVTKGKTVEIELGQVEYIDKKVVSYFACCANIGLGAELAKRANSGIRSYIGDFLGTFVSLLSILMSYRGDTVEINYGDKKKIIKDFYNISVGITPLIASGIKVKDAVNREKGKFYIMIVKKRGIKTLINSIYKIYKGDYIKKDRGIELIFAEGVEVKSKDKIKLEFDGDPQGELPCKIVVARDKLELVVKEV